MLFGREKRRALLYRSDLRAVSRSVFGRVEIEGQQCVEVADLVVFDDCVCKVARTGKS